MPKQTQPSDELLEQLEKTTVRVINKEVPGASIMLLAAQADEAPAWSSPNRDSYLRKFYPTESFLAGAIYSVCARNAAYNIAFYGPEAGMRDAYRLLATANFYAGWLNFVMKVSLDLYTQDNACFIEVIRPARISLKNIVGDAKAMKNPATGDWMAVGHRGKPIDLAGKDYKIVDNPLDLPIGLAHLDAARCLGRDSRVYLADGTTKSICEVVRTKHCGPIWTVNNGGNLEVKNVTNWHETTLGNRYWLHLKTCHARHVFGRKEGLWVTNDHPILTKEKGWIPAECISVGDHIYTRWPDLSIEQAEILTGTLLGDAHLGSVQGKRLTSHIGLIHSLHQEEWLCLKLNALRSLGWGKLRLHISKKQKQVDSRFLPCLSEWRLAWYPQGKKVVNKKYVERFFSARMLATWYMDDGSISNGKRQRPGGRLYTNDFSIDDTQWLTKLLTEHGIEAIVRFHNDRGKKHPYIYITATGMEAFARLIGPFVPPSMRYKLPSYAPHYNSVLWQDVKQGPLYADEITEIHEGDNGKQTTAYCIDVEDNHNFIAGNLVVHNCTRTGIPEAPVVYVDTEGASHLLKWYQVVTLEDLPSAQEDKYGIGLCAVSRALRLAQTLRDITILKQEKVSGRFAGSIWLTNVGHEVIQDAVDAAVEHADNRGLTRYMPPIIADTIEPNAEPRVAEIALASLPENFNEDEALRWYIAGLALDLGVDYGFLAPLPGNRLGTAQQAEVAERQSRGKASRLFMKQMEEKFNYYGLLPRNVWMEYKEVDTAEEMERDTAKARRAKTRADRIMSGEITPEIARQIAVDEGDLDPAYLKMLEEEDVTPGQAPQEEKPKRRRLNLGFGKRPRNTAIETKPEDEGEEIKQKKSLSTKTS